MRIPEKSILKWVEKTYGVGGFENYESEDIGMILKGMYILLKESGLIELEYLGKLFIQLSNHPEKFYMLQNELEQALN
jgi:hypothetical protein